MLPAGYSSDFAEDINNLGQVTGYVTTPSASSQAIRWTSGGGYELLSTLGGTDSTGLAINDNSVVVGTSDTGVGIQTRSFPPSGGRLDTGSRHARRQFRNRVRHQRQWNHYRKFAQWFNNTHLSFGSKALE